MLVGDRIPRREDGRGEGGDDPSTWRGRWEGIGGRDVCEVLQKKQFSYHTAVSSVSDEVGPDLVEHLVYRVHREGELPIAAARGRRVVLKGTDHSTILGGIERWEAAL